MQNENFEHDAETSMDSYPENAFNYNVGRKLTNSRVMFMASFINQ